MNSELKKSLTTLLKNTYDTHEQSIKKTLPEKQFRKIKKLANDPELYSIHPKTPQLYAKIPLLWYIQQNLNKRH